MPPSVPYHCGDGYFAKKTSSDEVVALQLHPSTKLRSAAHCLFLSTGPHPHRRGPRGKSDGKVNFEDRRRFAALGTLEERDPVPLSTALLWHGSLKRKLRVGVLVKRKDPHKPRYSVWASTDLAGEGRKRGAYYGARCQIECLLRDSKQCTGLADGQARAEAALDCQFTAALATLNLVRAEDLLASPPQAPQVFSMASCKQRYVNERLLAVFIESLALDPTWVKITPGMTNSGLTARLPPDFVRTIVKGKLVYVGKASKETTQSKRTLRGRLNEHVGKIDSRQNITLAEMQCRYLTFSSE